MTAVRSPLIAMIGLLAVLAAACGTAAANSKYAALVVHAETGDVLFDRYADETRYPASLTKMMTLYLLFEAIEAGEYEMDDELRVSRRASLQPASKLGLRQGSEITVETAIDALIIKSANDVATVVAEALGGSESGFAREMTLKARELGMRRTVFRNASGLPNSRQVTTARDLAALSRRLIQDFPQHADLFVKESFVWDGRVYRSHNRVTMSLPGAEGLKTGYTRASGYNLATTARRGDHRLIGIVLGGRSGATRDRHMKDIVNAAFLEIERKPSLINPILAARPAPRLKPGSEGAVLMAAVAPEATVEEAPIVATAAPLIMASAATELNLAGLKMAIDDVANDDGAIDEAVYGQGDAESPGSREWLVQVGAYSRQEQAIDRIKAVQEEIYAVRPDVRREVNIAEQRGRNVFRARFTRMTAYEAETACGALRRGGEDCLTLRMASGD